MLFFFSKDQPYFPLPPPSTPYSPESHCSLSSEERSRLCRCLNYEKLSLEVCKELTKNARTAPGITVLVLISQQSKIATKELGQWGVLRPEAVPEWFVHWQRP
jgi:hypothetical protein